TSNALAFSIIPAVPVPTSVINGASFTGLPPAPGAIATLFGTNLASGETRASGLPLLTTLGNTTVRLNNIAAPLFFVSPTQINFQIPWELAGTSSTLLTVTSDIGGGNPGGALVTLSPAAPGIFSLNSQGTGQGAILISNTATYAAPANSVPGSSARPVNRGESITIYCSGLGAVSNPPASGAAAGANPVSRTVATPTVSV